MLARLKERSRGRTKKARTRKLQTCRGGDGELAGGEDAGDDEQHGQELAFVFMSIMAEAVPDVSGK
jgi:hypothetical protein